MRPNFLVIGAMKSATTTLWEILRRHPQIFMPAQKNLAFFVRTAKERLPVRRWCQANFRMNPVIACEQIGVAGYHAMAMELPLCARRAPGA
jgi:hypothetical protein